jgi:hypothetical protein
MDKYREHINRFKRGDNVSVNGNHQARILEERLDIGNGVYEVRLWSDHRHVGDIIANEKDISMCSEDFYKHIKKVLIG